MQRGIIGVPASDADRLTTVEPYHDSRREHDQTLHAAIDPQTQDTLTGDVEFITGLALKEQIDDDSEWVYDRDSQSIDKRSTRTKVQHTSAFVAVPATEEQNGFAMVSSSDGVFAFELIGSADLTPMDRATIDLGDFYFANEDSFTVQTAGGSSDYADTVMAWGSELEDDSNVGRPVEMAAKSNTLPQLAGDYISDTVTEPMRVNLAASGYVEVWEPEMSTYEFLNWVREDILPFVRGVGKDGTDKSERAAADENQQTLDESSDDVDEDEPEWTEGTCENCGHERTKTRVIHGQRYCIICIEAGEVSDA